MSRTRRYLRGVGGGYALQALTMVGGLLLTPFLLGRLGAGRLGLWLIGIQVMAWLHLLDLGVVGLLPREVASATALPEGERAQAVARRFWTALKLAVGQTALMALVAGVLAALVPGSWAEQRPAILLGLAAFVLSYPLRVFPAMLEGLQEPGFLSVAQMVAWVLGTGVTVGLVLAGGGLASVVWGWLAQQVACALLAAVRLWQRHRELVRFEQVTLGKQEVGGSLRRGIWVSVGKLATLLLNNSDLLVVGKVLGPAATVVYACTGRLVSTLVNPPLMLASSAVPALSQVRAGESRSRMLEVCSSLTLATLLTSGLIATVVIAVNGAFVSWWVGAERDAGLALVLLLVLNMMLRHWSVSLSSAAFCFGSERRIALTALAEGLLGLGVCWGAVHVLGMTGAPLGALAGLVLVGLPSMARAMARHAGAPVREVLRPVLPWAWRTALALGLAVAMALLVRPTGFVGLALLSAVAAVTYAVLGGPLVLRPPLEAYVRPRWEAAKARLLAAGPRPGPHQLP